MSLARPLFLVALGACSLVVDSSNLAEGPTNARSTVADGGGGADVTSTSDGSALDGDGQDAGPTDATDVMDAPPDGGSFCTTLSPTPAYCDDFDEDAGIAWECFLRTLDAAVASCGVTSGQPKSPPRALRLAIPTVNAAGAEIDNYAIRRDLMSLTASHSVRLAFDVLITTRPGGGLPIAAIYFMPGVGIPSYMMLTLSAGGDDLVVYGVNDSGMQNPTAHRLNAPLKAGGWRHVELLFTFASGVELSVDGADVLGGVVPLDPSFTPNANLDISLGIHAAPASTPDIELRFDNVVGWVVGP